MNMKEHILMAMKEQLDCWEELLKGLSVTGSYFFARKFTLQYP